MTQREFNQILGSISTLSPEQMRQLRRELDSKLATATAKQPAATQPSPTEPSTPPKRKPLWERAAELRQSIPAEEWDKLPTDGATQLDHYIYGSPKRTGA